MDQQQFKTYSKSKNTERTLKVFSKSKSNKIVSDIKKKINSTKQIFTEVNKKPGSKESTRESILVVDYDIMLDKVCDRPSGLTEVRRDGKDNDAVARVIQQEFRRCEERGKTGEELCRHMESFASACWLTMESIHVQMLEDETPENERIRMDPDHWYELSLTNSSLFANLAPEKVEGMEQLVPGRLFTTRMPRDLNDTTQHEAADFITKVEKNKLKVVFCLTETEEFEKYAGVENLMDFYRQDCGLVVYNRAIPDFQIPTEGDLVDNILDLTYHLAEGDNCLIHCAGGTGRTGMVVAAIIQNFGVHDVIARIRKVKSTYVETPQQELFLKNMPKALNSKIVETMPKLACAIAAEHLIELFRTHKSKLEDAKTEEEKVLALQRMSSVTCALDIGHEQKLRDAYGQIFDVIDHDKSGCLDNEELSHWFEMVGAEIDMNELKTAILGDGEEFALQFTRERFTDFMSKRTKHHRRDYELGTNA